MLKQLNRGDDAPLFTLLNQNGEPVSLAQFRGKKVLVYFYPKALTPGCTTQACGLRDSKAELDKFNLIILILFLSMSVSLPLKYTVLLSLA